MSVLRSYADETSALPAKAIAMKNTISAATIAAILLMTATFSIQADKLPFSADLIIINARTHTMDQGQPLAEAVAVSGNRIIAVGTTKEIGKLSQPGGPLYQIEVSNGGLISFPGGVPIKTADGTIIGAIGVSGSTVDNDHAVGTYLALTGYPHPRSRPLGVEPPASASDMPSLGSILSKDLLKKWCPRRDSNARPSA